MLLLPLLWLLLLLVEQIRMELAHAHHRWMLILRWLTVGGKHRVLRGNLGGAGWRCRDASLAQPGRHHLQVGPPLQLLLIQFLLLLLLLPVLLQLLVVPPWLFLLLFLLLTLLLLLPLHGRRRLSPGPFLLLLLFVQTLLLICLLFAAEVDHALGCCRLS